MVYLDRLGRNKVCERLRAIRRMGELFFYFEFKETKPTPRDPLFWVYAVRVDVFSASWAGYRHVEAKNTSRRATNEAALSTNWRMWFLLPHLNLELRMCSRHARNDSLWCLGWGAIQPFSCIPDSAFTQNPEPPSSDCQCQTPGAVRSDTRLSWAPLALLAGVLRRRRRARAA